MKSIWKYISIIALSGLAIVVPVTSIALTSQKSFISNNNDSSNGSDNGDSNGDNDSKPPVIPETPIKINSNISITTSFTDILKGFETQKTMNDAMTDILNKEENISKVVTNYEQFENKNIELKVTGIQQNSSAWGTTPYSTWGTSATTKAIVNNYSDIFTISTLNDLKTQLTSQKISELVNASGLTGSYSNYEINSDSALGVEQFGDGVKDLVHVNITATNTDALSRTTTNIDLGIPISNIKYDIKSAIITGTTNDKTKEINTTSEINVSFGIDSKIENNYTNDIVFQPDAGSDSKSNITLQELLTRFHWSNQLSQFSTLQDVEQATNLDSNKIGKDLGIYNVDFLNVKNSTDIPIGTDGYDGIDLTFTIKPKTGFSWEDGTETEKELKVGKIQAKIQDGYMSVNAKWFAQDRRYEIEWANIFNDDESLKNDYPDNLEKMKEKFADNDFYNKFWFKTTTYNEYKNDFKNVKFKITQGGIGIYENEQKHDKNTYSLTIIPEPLPGHLMKSNSIQTNEAGYYKLVYLKQ